MTAKTALNPASIPTLRDYQTRGIEAIEQLIMSGKKRVLAVAPTGAGKGTMATAMLARTAQHGGTALFVVHRREILLDVAARLRAQGVTPGLMFSDKPDRTRPIQLASIQSLIHAHKRRIDVDLLVIDEAHHYAAEEWSGVSTRVRAYATVGFTATPQRADGRPLGDVFDVMIDVVSYSELLSRGHIVPCRVLRPEAPLGIDLAQDAADAFFKYAAGSQGFVFARSLSHAREVERRLERGGARAVIVSHETSDEDRRLAIEGMRARAIDVIVNYFTMTEGIDIPSVSTIVLARNVQHEGAYMQMVGRALRAYPGKREALVLDLCGASYVHGLPLQNRAYSLRERAMRLAGDVTEHKARAAPDASHVIDCELVEATEEQQRMWGRRRIDWSKVGLGERLDREVAESVGVSTQLVAKMRKMRGLKPKQGTSKPKIEVDWVAVGIGTRSDAEIARELGCHEDSVRKARKRLGIERTTRGRGVRHQIDWDAQPLGQVADVQIADKLGVGSATVHEARVKRGIAPYGGRGGSTMRRIDWDAQPLGKVPDSEIAKQLLVSKKSVIKARLARRIEPCTTASPRRANISHIHWRTVPLGKRSDYAIAQELGIPLRQVQIKRESLGIAAFQWKRSHTGIDWDELPYGEVSDAKLAKQMGVAITTVRRNRIRRGILQGVSRRSANASRK